MSKISISKKTAWSLILKINSKISHKDNLVNINEDIRGHKINIIYNKSNDHIENSNLSEIVFSMDFSNSFLYFNMISKKYSAIELKFHTGRDWLISLIIFKLFE